MQVRATPVCGYAIVEDGNQRPMLFLADDDGRQRWTRDVDKAKVFRTAAEASALIERQLGGGACVVPLSRSTWRRRWLVAT